MTKVIIIGTGNVVSKSLAREMIIKRAIELGIPITIVSDESSIEELQMLMNSFEIMTYDECTKISMADEARMLKPAQPYYREHFEGRKKKGGRRKY